MPNIQIDPKMWILGHQAAAEVALLRTQWEAERHASMAGLTRMSANEAGSDEEDREDDYDDSKDVDKKKKERIRRRERQKSSDAGRDDSARTYSFRDKQEEGDIG